MCLIGMHKKFTLSDHVSILVVSKNLNPLPLLCNAYVVYTTILYWAHCAYVQHVGERIYYVMVCFTESCLCKLLACIDNVRDNIINSSSH